MNRILDLGLPPKPNPQQEALLIWCEDQVLRRAHAAAKAEMMRRGMKHPEILAALRVQDAIFNSVSTGLSLLALCAYAGSGKTPKSFQRELRGWFRQAYGDKPRPGG